MDGTTTPAPAHVYTDSELGKPVQWVVCSACGWVSEDLPTPFDAYSAASRHNRRRHPVPVPSQAESA